MPNRMTRHDMLVEIVSDLINTVEDQANTGEREELEAWLAPIIHEHLARGHMNEDDSAVAALYETHTGNAPRGWEEEE